MVNRYNIKNNKGLVVEQYEPYLETGFDYVAAPDDANLARIRLKYDVLGRNTRVDYDDGTFEKMEFDAWQQKNHDRNDTVIDSDWYSNRNSPDPAITTAPTDKDERAAWLAAKHYDTPQVLKLDSLGRMFLRQDDLGASTLDTRFAYDLLGRRTQSTDPRGLVTSYSYGLIPPPKEEEPQILYNNSPDAGKRYLLNDVTGKPNKRWNSRGFSYRHEYDAMQRPTELWITPSGASEYLAEKNVYGESQGASLNHRGQLYQSFDQAGKITVVAYDFKGNAIQQERQFAEEYQTAIDYDSSVNYETETYEEEGEFDALNRPSKQISADNTERLMSYKRSALLEAVELKVKGGTTEDAITAINYNARGQRTEVFYANGSKTTNTYDAATFRLKRILSTRNSGADILQDLNYTFDAAGNIVHLKDDAQQTIYFSNAVVVPENKYEYDALYRLKKATGRQLIGLNAAPTNADIQIKNPVPDSDTSAMETYTRTYTYDANGNMTQMKNVAGSSWTKDFYYEANNNRLDRHSDPGSSEYNYDSNGNLIDGPSIFGLSYNENDQIIEADLGGGGTAYYCYDSSGERIRKVIVNGVNKKERLYLDNYEVYREIASGSVQLERETVYCSDDRKRFLQLDTLLKEGGTDVSSPTTEWRYQFDNNIGSACLELDDTASIISYEEYFPFGATSYHSGKSEAEVKRKRFRYTGKERDEETGLYYYGARYYAPWLARFTSADPMGMVDGASLYAYVRNNPIKLNDPDGMQAGGEDEKENDEGITTTVQSGEGPTQIAERLRQTLGINIKWTDIVDHPDNVKYFGKIPQNERHNPHYEGFKKLNLNEGDIINFNVDIIDNAKPIKEKKLIFKFGDEDFEKIEPTYTSEELKQIGEYVGSKAVTLLVKEFLKKIQLGKVLDFFSYNTKTNSVDFEVSIPGKEIADYNYERFKLTVQGKLRTVGEGSSLRFPIQDLDGNKGVGIIKYTGNKNKPFEDEFLFFTVERMKTKN